MNNNSNLDKDDTDFYDDTPCLCFKGGAGYLKPVSSALGLNKISFAEPPCDDAYLLEYVFVNFTKEDWLWLGKQMNWLPKKAKN